MQVLVKKPVVIIAALIVLASCGATGCGGKNPYPSVSSVAGEWLAIKTELSPPTAGIEKKIENFRTTLDRFSASPVGLLYQVHRPDEIKSLADIAAAAERLQTAALNGEKETAETIKLEIDTGINELQHIDQSLSDTSQLHYFQLFFFFAALVIGAVLSLRILSSRLKKAENRERQSLEFSRETVIAQERERERLARELHDTVVQDLAGLSFQTDLISRSEDSRERSRLCAEVVGGQQGLMIRVRDICDNLISPDFQFRRLEGSLQRMCYLFEQRTKIECHVTIQDNLQLGSLSLDSQLQCFRIVQECLANVEKHSQATMAPVVIRNSPVVINNRPEGELLIIVSDDGKGFRPPGQGILPKTERAKTLRPVGPLRARRPIERDTRR